MQHVYTSDDDHRVVRIYAALEGRSSREVVADAIALYRQSHPLEMPRRPPAPKKEEPSSKRGSAPTMPTPAAKKVAAIATNSKSAEPAPNKRQPRKKEPAAKTPSSIDEELEELGIPTGANVASNPFAGG